MGTKIIGVIVLFLVVLNIHAQNITEVQSSKVNDMLKTDKGWVVLDVRTPQEFSQGHLPGALNIDIYQNNALEKLVNLTRMLNILFIAVPATEVAWCPIL
ncbi:MAG: rhodanese-like domain-containing protein [Bacteroidetes bacterium]|nr:rhodanese-like domain-containing protein [Bacteroidota bacterium]